MISTKRLHSIHKWAGLIAGINMLILSVTGAYLVFYEDIHAFSETAPTEVVLTIDPDSAHPMQDAVDALLAANPGTEAIRARIVEGKPDEREIVLADGSHYPMYWLNMVTGEVREHSESALHAFNDFVFTLHANLFLGLMGTFLLGIVGLIFLTSTVSGLIIYGPFMKQALFGVFRKDKGVRRASADLHKLVGSAALMFNLLMAVTGIALTFGMLGVQYWSLKMVQERTAGETVQEVAGLPPVDDVWAAASGVHPDTPVATIAYPGGYQGKNYYLVYHETGEGISRYVLTLSLVPVAQPGAAEDLDIPLWIEAIMICFPLHFGNFAGLGLKIAYSLFGLMTGVLTTTGAIMTFSVWGSRLRARRRSRVPAKPVVAGETPVKAES